MDSCSSFARRSLQRDGTQIHPRLSGFEEPKLGKRVISQHEPCLFLSQDFTGKLQAVTSLR